METYKLRETSEKREEPGKETRRSSQPSSRGLWKLPARPLSVPSEAQSPTSRSTDTFQSSRVPASLGTLRPSADTLQPTPQPPQPPSQHLPLSSPPCSSEPAQVAVGTLPALPSNEESLLRFNSGWILPESEKRRRPREPRTLKLEDTTPFQPSHPSYGTSSQPSLQPPAQDLLHPSHVPEPAQVIAGAPPCSFSSHESFLRFNTGWILPESERRRHWRPAPSNSVDVKPVLKKRRRDPPPPSA